jgi:glycosyltransferase involved in cell wall biosynthesis
VCFLSFYILDNSVGTAIPSRSKSISEMILQKNVLIVESNVHGHYGIYLKKFLQYFLSNKFRVTLVLDSGPDAAHFLDEYLINISGFEDVVVVRSALLYNKTRFSLLGLCRDQLHFWRACASVYRQVLNDQPIDLVFVPYFDRLLHVIPILGSPFGSAPIVAITMRPVFHLRQQETTITGSLLLLVKRLVFEQMLKITTVYRVYTIDPSFIEYSKFCKKSCWRKLDYFPDPVEQIDLQDQLAACIRLGIDQGADILLLYGAMDMRKGISEALAWVQQERKLGQNIKLLIAGRQSDSLKLHISRSEFARNLKLENGLFVIDRYLSEEEEALVFSAASFVWLKYQGFWQMSGVMVKAGMANKPMILPNYGVMGWFRERLMRSCRYPDFSIPRLVSAPECNPFNSHEWRSSLKNLDATIDKLNNGESLI